MRHATSKRFVRTETTQRSASPPIFREWYTNSLCR
jgi:hypothetical protein